MFCFGGTGPQKQTLSQKWKGNRERSADPECLPGTRVKGIHAAHHTAQQPHRRLLCPPAWLPGRKLGLERPGTPLSWSPGYWTHPLAPICDLQRGRHCVSFTSVSGPQPSRPPPTSCVPWAEHLTMTVVITTI